MRLAAQLLHELLQDLCHQQQHRLPRLENSGKGWDDESMGIFPYKNIGGWWYTYPSEQYESQMGWLFPIYGKIKLMFQTINRINMVLEILDAEYPTQKTQ